MAFLDCTKAFDRISHFGLFIKLMERKVPLCLLLSIIFWHVNMTCRVKWGDAVSGEFDVPLGTKQGGIISPKFFSVYIDDIVKILRQSGVGCHLIKLFVGCLLFADDLAIMAPTRLALQKLIDLCSSYCEEFCLQFNSKKSKVMIFGKSFKEPITPLTINGLEIQFVDEWKYLGTTLVAGKSFAFTARPDLSAFFRASNTVLNVLTGAHEHTLLSLLFTNCVPTLTYACSVKEYSASDMSNCSIAMNSALRKIFGFTDWRSIRYLREIFGFSCLYTIFKNAKDRFASACRHHHNPVISFIASMHHSNDSEVT